MFKCSETNTGEGRDVTLEEFAEEFGETDCF